MTHGHHPLDDSIRTALGATADDIDVDLLSAGAIERRGRTRQRRRRFLGGGAAAVLAVGTVALVTRGGDDSIQTADDPAPATSLVEIASVDDDARTGGDDEAMTVITTPPTLPPADALTGEPATIPDVGSEMAADSVAYYGDGPGSLVPWGDGFLSMRMEYHEQPLAELPDDVLALFPDEVLALFPDGLPGTIDEATAILNDAGLYDVVSEIVLEHPEAFDAIYAAPTPDPTPVVEFTVDGQTWTDVGADLPDMSYGQITVSGDSIVVWSLDEMVYDDSGRAVPIDSRILTVARSTDLVSWDTTTTEIPVDLDQRAYVNNEVWVQQVTPTTSGWVAIVQSSTWVDEYQILPDDIRDRLDREPGGWNLQWTETGVDVEIWDDSGNGMTVESYTWADLGIDPLDENTVYGGSATFELLVHDGDGFAFADAPDIGDGYLSHLSTDLSGRLVAVTGAGVFTSPDATDWTRVEGLPEAAWIDGGAPVEGGVLLVSSSTPTPRGWLLDGAGQLTEITMPDLGQSYGLWGPGASAAWIVEAYDDVGPTDYPDPDPVTFQVDRDGIAVTITVGTDLVISAVDTSTGESVLDYSGSLGDDMPDFIDPDSGELVITDAAGNELARFTDAELEAAYTEAMPGPLQVDGEYVVDEPASIDEYYGPDLWLLATRNGVDWLTLDLADPDLTSSYYWPPAAAVNGDRVLYHDGSGWQLITVG